MNENREMTLEQAMHALTGQLNYVMVEAHTKFNVDFNVQLQKDGATGLYLVAIEVVRRKGNGNAQV